MVRQLVKRMDSALHTGVSKSLHSSLCKVIIVELPCPCISLCAFVGGGEGSVLLAHVESMEDEDRLDVNIFQDLKFVLDVRFQREGETAQSRYERLLERSVGDESVKIEGCIDA